MELKDWILKTEDAALIRAQKEGYAVERGAAEFAIKRLAESLEMDLYFQGDWLSVVERTSPYAESFESRDRVVDAVKQLDLPTGWVIDISRISRIALKDGSFFTGVVLDARSGVRKHILLAALDFEAVAS